MTGSGRVKHAWAQIHPKVLGSGLGGLLGALITAELSMRLHVKLLPEEVGAITVAGGLIGGWLKRA